jgi:RimJ/RimL family protein N-acetyltransferase
VSSYRKLFPHEAAALGGHLARLSGEERSLRFMGAMSDEAVQQYCESLDWFRTVVIGFFEAGVLRGCAEMNIPDRRYPILCEVAITVETAWQDHGIATELLRRVLVVGQNRSVRGLHITCFGHNHRIQHIAEKFGAHFRSRDGEAEADIPAAAPTYSSFCEEAIDDGFGCMNVWLDYLTGRLRALQAYEKQPGLASVVHFGRGVSPFSDSEFASA